MTLYNYRFMENCVQEAPCIVKITVIKYFKMVFLNIRICMYKTPSRKSGHILYMYCVCTMYVCIYCVCTAYAYVVYVLRMRMLCMYCVAIYCVCTVRTVYSIITYSCQLCIMLSFCVTMQLLLLLLN